MSGSTTIREYTGDQMTKNVTIYLSGSGYGNQIQVSATSNTGDYDYVGAQATYDLMWNYVDNLPE